MIIIYFILGTVFVVMCFSEFLSWKAKRKPLYIKPNSFLFMYNGQSFINDKSMYPVDVKHRYANPKNFYVNIEEGEL